MKTLQSNFTTSEQSKRLLELGVPAWTADGFRWDFGSAFGISEDERYSTSIPVICYEYQRDLHDKLPCWSVGRLIEILNICSIWGNVSIHRTDREVTQIEQLIEILQNRINGKTINFSKLEE